MSTTPHKRQNISGFTLIELMFTLLIAAILLGVAVPSFRNLTASNRLTAQANELVGALNYARSEAITRNTNVTLCRTNTAASTTCNNSSSWSNWIVVNAAGTVARRGTINDYNSMILVESDLTASSITFGSDGMARTGGVLVSANEFTVCSAHSITDNVRRVAIGAGSRLSTSKDSGAC